MSGILPRGKKRVGSPLVSGRDSPAPGMRAQDERCDALNPQPHDQPAPPVKAQPSPRLMTSESARFAVQALQTAVEGGADLIVPLRDALQTVPEIRDILEKNYNVEVGFDALKRGLAAYRVVANAYASTDYTLSDDLQKHLSAIATIIQQLWRIVDDESNQEPWDQPTQHVQSSENAKTLFEGLRSLLEIFEFADDAAVEDHLVVLNQLLSPHSSAVEREDRAVVMFNRNSNTNYNSGSGNIVNNNSVSNLVTNFIFSGSNAPTTPDLAQKQSKALKEIKSILGDRFVHDAVYDTQPKDAGCMPGTRETILAKLMFWAIEGLMKIFWLAGMAGTGKTSIAVTLCRMLEDEPSVILGGTFFCSRTTGLVERTEVRRILPSLAASLAAQVPEFALALAAGLGEDDRAAHKPASDQIVTLLKKPLATIVPSSRPIIFVVDALDECSDQRELAELLIAIADFESDTTVKFILTSRPEMHIRGTPISNPKHNTILQLHTISEEEVSADIRRYVSATLGAVPTNTDWYAIDDVDALVRLSHGLFIFASTVLRYVLAREQIKGRKDRLRKATSTASSSSAATSSLDKIYEMIMHEVSRTDKVDDDELGVTRRVIACILAARASLSVQALAELLDFQIDHLRGSLENLHSVVYVPADDVVAGVRVLMPRLVTIFPSELQKMFASTYRSATALLSRDASTLWPSNFISTFRRVAPRINQTRQLGLTASRCRLMLDNEINETFRPRLLFWLEVASVLGRIQRATAMLHLATSTVRLPDLSHFLRDARRFIASSREAIERSAPHIYISALPFASKHSLVYKTFAPLCDGIISAETFGIDRHGGRLVMTLAGHRGYVNSVAYSADSHLLVSGGEDGTVRIWDTRTGEETMPPLRSGAGEVSSVAFAYSGRRVASGHSQSELRWRIGPPAPGIVCIWSIGTEQVIPRRLLGNPVCVSSVVFSSDDSILASVSKDGAVRLWKPETCENIAVLDDRDFLVNTVAFSPNGQILAACSRDKIQLWEAATCKLVGELPLRLLNGPSNIAHEAIHCLSFSPDGSTIAVGTSHNIHLWDLLTEKNVALGRYHDNVLSVQFSPDGSCIMSAGNDDTISLLKLQSGTVVVLSRDSNRFKVRSHPAMFSSDGLYIASGIASGNIQILDAGDSQVTVQALEAHEVAINSVAISPDGTIIVSGSEDGMVQVWDAQTGEPRLPPPLRHKGPVCSMTFSPDGSLITSCSTKYECSVRLWDAQTGGVVGDAINWQQTNGSTVTAPVFSSDARLFATGYRCQIAKTEEVVGKQESIGLPRKDSYVQVFEVSTGKPLILDPMRCEGLVQGIAFSWDDTILAAVTSEGWIHLWYRNTGQSVWEQQVYQRGPPVLLPSSFTADMPEEYYSTDRLDCVVFSPDASRVVSGGNDSIYVWDLSTRQLVLDLKHLSNHALLVSFSLCGRYILSEVNPSSDLRGSWDHSTVRLWDVSTGAQVATMRGHGNAVQSVVFTPDGQSIVSCSEDSTIRVWNIAAACSLSSAGACDPIAALSTVGIDNGWVLGPQRELLLWVPEEYRDFIQVPPCTLVIGRHRVVVTGGENGLHAGENWTSCWGGTTLSFCCSTREMVGLRIKDRH